MNTNGIRELNDTFRTTLRGGRAVMTSGVAELPACVKAEAMVQIAHFSDFTADNDPHGEHDPSVMLCAPTVVIDHAPRLNDGVLFTLKGSGLSRSGIVPVVAVKRRA